MIELIDVSLERERIVPFEIELCEGKEILIRALPCLADFADRFEKRYENCYLSREAIDDIRKHCAEMILPLGFCEDVSSAYCIYEYSADGVLINEKFVRSDSHVIKNLSEVDFGKRILFDVYECIKSGGIASVTVNNGVVVSVAAVNMPFDEEKTVEITTETAVGYRGMGLAASNVASVILELKKMGITPVYRCRSTNFASLKVAEKVRLKREKIIYRYLCVRKNTN